MFHRLFHDCFECLKVDINQLFVSLCSDRGCDSSLSNERWLSLLECGYDSMDFWTLWFPTELDWEINRCIVPCFSLINLGNNFLAVISIKNRSMRRANMEVAHISSVSRSDSPWRNKQESNPLEYRYWYVQLLLILISDMIDFRKTRLNFHWTY